LPTFAAYSIADYPGGSEDRHRPPRRGAWLVHAAGPLRPDLRRL